VTIARGQGSSQIVLKVRGDRAYVLVEGEPRGDDVIDVVRAGLDQGVLHGNMRTLVDLTGFIGSVDWPAIQTVRRMTRQQGDSDARVAYVVRNNLFAPLIRIVEALFSHSRHRTFHTYTEAIAWLDSDEPE